MTDGALGSRLSADLAAPCARPGLDRDLLTSGALAQRADIRVPDAALLDLPVKAVQFGTGAFLRGFVDYFLDEANRAGGGLFGGRVVAIGSTGSGRDQRLNEQDGLYTLVMQGVEGGERRREARVISSLSRAMSARDEWDQVLALARLPELELVFSNTTEVGIVLDESDTADAAPPRSFPAKLARFLHERGRAFDWNPERGVVVVPCELIEDNGDRLREIVLALAERWGLEPAFAAWVREAVPFCNTLVDRIVPGAPMGADAEALRASLGYDDEMLTTCEVYRLFAIQPPPLRSGFAETLRRGLRFAGADAGIVIADDIAPFRELKVRLLNGAHTTMVPLAILAGCETVREAVEHPLIGAFVRRAMLDEIVPGVRATGAGRFARDVLDRFANPYIRHALFDITLQGTMKLRVRVVPSILAHAARTGRAPESLALGFAAYLLFMRGDAQEARRRAGLAVPADDQGERVRALWSSLIDASPDGKGLPSLVRAACGDRTLWGVDLGDVPGFADAVTGHLAGMIRSGVASALESHLAS